MKLKVSIIFIFWLVFLASYSQNIQFSDTNLKNRLLSALATNTIAGSGNLTYDGFNNFPTSYEPIDTNHDFEIQQSEALAITYLELGGASIGDLSGLEYFVNLKYLSIIANNLTTINLTPFYQLENLKCQNNQLTTINLSGLINLKYLFCSANPINNINFSGLPNLIDTYCAGTLVSSLNFTDNPMFETVYCSYNPNLTTLKIKNGRDIIFPNASYCFFDGNPHLNYICADASEIPIILAHQAANCSIINPTCVIDSACVLGTEGFELENVSVYPNPSNGIFNLTTANYTKIQVYTILGEKLLEQNITSDNFNINLTIFASGCYIAKLTNNEKTTQVTLIKN